MKYLSIAVLFCIVGCSQPNTSVHYNSFEEYDSLIAISHEIPPIMLYPRNIFLSNNNIVVFNEKMDTIFQVFDQNNFSYKYSFGIKGQGPNDFIMPSTQRAGTSRKGFAMLDVKTIKEISFLENVPVIQTNVISAPFEYFNGFIRLNDSLYCCDAGFEEEHEFMFIYPNGSFKQWGDYPEDIARLGTRLSRNQAYGKISVAKPDGKRFASFYYSQRRCRIYDDTGNLLHDILLDIPPFEELPNKESNERYIHTIAVSATEQYIYTLNLDMKADEIYAQNKYPNIQVFSWDGKPLKQYWLNVFISAFTIDEEQNMIYAIFAEDDSHIYTFKLK
ncbi:BF3164 family lipoprotein [uncultured Bacteroides sp.]|uniref:BF3164 family lipoprotein n=1 Tax=uncultured Bacteroides sp. TaxID=162156 RepID=UPI0025D1A8F5|nr:BF3164 family lipoprotein [uncultured Bacteroides sp.]